MYKSSTIGLDWLEYTPVAAREALGVAKVMIAINIIKRAHCGPLKAEGLMGFCALMTVSGFDA